MCVCYPGTVIEIRDMRAKVDFGGTTVEALNAVAALQPGDRVLVHAGCVMQVLTATEAEELMDLYAQIDAFRKEELGSFRKSAESGETVV